ncbi:hypothetical protein OUZ56_028654 [Daphnia magna]|uniref:Secreted protein n=1 Tax=Daphnia magna TaxID=35525 RepID=A0ABR0B4I0_9CRUS|nr:hypothetical protein OUZ56_028654 [Daphnia magna]
MAWLGRLWLLTCLTLIPTFHVMQCAAADEVARSGVHMCCKGEVTGWVVDDVERNWRVSYDRWLDVSSSVGEQVELPSLTTTT